MHKVVKLDINFRIFVYKYIYSIYMVILIFYIFYNLVNLLVKNLIQIIDNYFIN